MATLSLNGNFNYPIELKQSFTVNGDSTFNSGINHGYGNVVGGQHAIASGNNCTVMSDFSRVYGHDSAVGYGSMYSCAAGESCSAYGEDAFALGYNSSTMDANNGNVHCDRSFVWQGDSKSGNIYYSKGAGTFCINPQCAVNIDSVPASTQPLCGFFVGNDCITVHISSESAKRILNNKNVFNALQIFDRGAEFSGNGDVVFYGNVEFASGSNMSINGQATISTNNTVSNNVLDDEGIANHSYVNTIALSAVSSVGQYYDDLTGDFFDTHSEWATPLRFVQTYVASSINDVDSFIGDGDVMRSAASREYVLTMATSASTHVLTSNNVFSGVNTFRNDVIFNDDVSTSDSATINITRGNVVVREPANVYDTVPNTISTEVFTRNVATSAVNHILNASNTYTGNNIYRGNSEIRGNMVLNGGLADFREGTVYVAEPNTTSMMDNEVATTVFTRNVAASAVDHLLSHGGMFSNASNVIFGGNVSFLKSVDFNAYDGVEVSVKTQKTGNSSNYAASTEFVSNTISTSSVSVKNLIVGSSLSDNSRENYYFTTNKFLNKNIYVSTMEDSCADEHAASCEWVKRVIGSLQTFDLFDIKYMDYVLPETSPWKMQGTTIYDVRNPAYRHIQSEFLQNRGRVITETVAGVSISYVQSTDGHKIIDASVEKNVVAVNKLFDTAGVAWFYLIDMTGGKERLVLPRTSYYHKVYPNPIVGGLSSTDISRIGRYNPSKIPSHTHSFNIGRGSEAGHGDGLAHHGSNYCSSISGTTGGASFPSTIVQEGNVIQPPSTDMLLYLYCG